MHHGFRFQLSYALLGAHAMTSLVGRTFCALIATACITAPQAHAQGANAVSGEYCLVGVREVGSCMRFSSRDKWEYFLSYGAYDERSEGTWKAANGGVVVNSPPCLPNNLNLR